MVVAFNKPTFNVLPGVRASEKVSEEGLLVKVLIWLTAEVEPTLSLKFTAPTVFRTSVLDPSNVLLKVIPWPLPVTKVVF